MTVGPNSDYRAAADRVDTVLVSLYLLGLYLGVEVRLTPGTPVPMVLSGLAGGLLLLKHMHRLRETQVALLLLIVLLYLGAILTAADPGHLGKRFTGLLQLSYGFIIGYGFFLTLMLFQPAALARIFGWFCAALIAGCCAEVFLDPFRVLSDTVRGVIFDFGVYIADQRDLELYGQIRPKLFTSEPSAVSFSFVLFAFCWYALSTWRWKLITYLGGFAAAFYLMRGPTLLLGLVLLAPYELLLAPRRNTAGGPGYDFGRGMLAVGLTAVLTAGAIVIAGSLFAQRLAEIQSGTDPSFFSRVVAPYLTAVEVIRERPIAGIGLTSESLIDGMVNQIYAQSPALVSQYSFTSAKYALTNYFWMHWIYNGAVWGLILLAAITIYVRSLGMPNLLFCWSVWAVLGQASGAYVSPKTWTVLYLACAISVLQRRGLTRQRVSPWRDEAAPAVGSALRRGVPA